ERLRDFPTGPGVYIMKDQEERIIYVGKASNLRARLRSYFARSVSDERFFVRLLGKMLGDIEVVLTSTPQEALLMENELIKTHQPRFNVQLKDDKNFLNLRLASDHQYPRLEVVRRRKKDGARYFGPYASATSIRRTLRLINRHFQLRTCKDSEFKNRSRPCLEYQIKRCPAPCVLELPDEEYDASVRDVMRFLEGKGDELVADLRAKMSHASESTEFERAAHYRDQATAIERSLERQDVVMSGLDDLDVFGIAREGPMVAIHMQQVRRGRVRSAQVFKLGRDETPDDLLLDQFLQRFYLRGHDVPAEVLLPTTVQDQVICQAWLIGLRGRSVKLRVPQRGERRRLVVGANRNAENALRLDRDRANINRETLLELQKRLRLTRFPERIECFDISNVQGTDPVASMVVFIDAEADNSEYRHFHIRSLNTPNDFQMMYEALRRRFFRAQKGDWEAPDLLVVDGGKGQLSMAIQVLSELEVSDVDVVSLAKSRLLNSDPNAALERSPERVFLPNVKDPIILKQNSAPLYLLARLRDEAHRFAISFHRSTRKKRKIVSSLDKIVGIGPAKRKALLRHFGSLKKVKHAEVFELIQVSGINRDLAERIKSA
ncbi:MAG TPA: excinuclease ABC subunit UvrC, partial [Myxococcales bacterium]|nr:excinuclease ABC subunit UvrC [Myxococcales bacterium]